MEIRAEWDSKESSTWNITVSASWTLFIAQEFQESLIDPQINLKCIELLLLNQKRQMSLWHGAAAAAVKKKLPIPHTDDINIIVYEVFTI